MIKNIVYLTIGLVFFSCTEENIQTTEEKVLFELKDSTSTGFTFNNSLAYDKDFNVYKYRNFYNGGGVAIGDVNNDGFEDIYMVSNQGKNKLFLNKGNWKFEDISESAGIGGERAWSTGVTMVDINADGYLDIYVCNSGDVKGDNKENELFINNGDLTFTEQAEEYNLNDKGFSTHASFFDYDKDGDLDVYILNNSFQAIGSFNLRKNERPVRNELGGDKLMRNDDGRYVDVSEDAGIYGSVIGFGLGITVGDVNNDQWEDIFISNDFFERDYLYINQKDGTFKEDLENQMLSISGASMGADIADINGDGYNEIFVTEMLPNSKERLKSVTTFEDWDRYNLGFSNGYHHQFTRNVLHLNNGNNTFSEISRFLGVEASDWSWGALFFDMDNDGFKDLFIANGIYRDLTNQDYLQYIANESVMASVINDDGVNYKKLIDIIPSNKIPNQSYKNNGDLTFEEFTTSGLNTPSFSNGSAYGDLDNDGDLDLVVNNVNMPSFLYENKADSIIGNNYLTIEFEGSTQNTYGYGAEVILTKASGDEVHYEFQPARGFQSSMENKLTIGLGKEEKVDIKVIWPENKVSDLNDISTNQKIKVSIDEAIDFDNADSENNEVLLELITDGPEILHKENNYNDFNQERLRYHMISTSGPCASIADLDGDDVNEILLPGPLGSSDLIIAKEVKEIIPNSKSAEHTRCDVFDADGDGDLDIYMASGGVELSQYSDLLYDVLALNDGNGNFTTTNQKLPNTEARSSTGAVAHGDIDGDGDTDLFVGERLAINKWGKPVSGFILSNDGKGNFEDVTSNVCPELAEIGMITDALLEDLDGDKDLDLIVVGEFMPITIFSNNGGKLTKLELDESLSGWWNVVKAVDIDNDGDLDIVAGNHGTNSKFKTTPDHPIRLYYNDFDNNSFPEAIMTYESEEGNIYPYALRHNLAARLPILKKKFPDFESYKNATIEDVFSKEQLESSIVYKADELRSLVLINDGNMNFEKVILPKTVQISPMYAIAHYDLNKDGFEDLIMGGNLYKVQPEAGRYDASYGHILINQQDGTFKDESRKYGFSVKGEIRDIEVDNDIIYIFRNNDSVLKYKLKS